MDVAPRYTLLKTNNQAAQCCLTTNIYALWTTRYRGNKVCCTLTLTSKEDAKNAKNLMKIKHPNPNKPKIGPNRCARVAILSLSLPLIMSHGTVEAIESDMSGRR